MGAVRRVAQKVTSDQIRRYEGLIFTTTTLIDEKVELDFDDIRQRLRLKVWRALELYDASCGMSEQNYVFMCVVSEKKDLLKRVKYGTVFIEDIAPTPTGVDRTDAFLRTARDRFDERYLSVCADEVFAAVEDDLVLPETLTPVERTIVEYLMKGYMQTETAAELGLTKGRMEAAIRRIRLKLTLWLGGDQNEPRRVAEPLERATA